MFTRTLRQLLLWSFALAALSWLSLSWFIFTTVRDALAETSHPSLWFVLRDISLGLVVPTLSILFGIAWWMLFRRKPSARLWTILGSFALSLSALALIYLLPSSWLWATLLLILGITGIITFATRSGPALAPPAQAKPPRHIRVPGDGTSPFLDKFVWFVSIAVGAIGTIWLLHWGDAHHLPDTTSQVTVLLGLFFISLAVIAIHEAGHALAAKALGMKLLGLVVGPFIWQYRLGNWKFQFKPAGLLSFKGLTLATPVTFDNFSRRKVIMIAAGPLACLLACVIAAAMTFLAPHRPWQQQWLLLAWFAIISFIGFAGPLIPSRISDTYSDGARLYQLYKGGLWTDYYRAIFLVMSSAVTAIRPRDFDLDAMQRAAGTVTRGQSEFTLHLCCYSCLFDRRQFTEAGQAIARAGEVYEQYALKSPAEQLSPLVFGHAFVRRDPTAARLWWNRTQSAKPAFPDSDQNLSLAALLWTEGRLDEARDAWQKGHAWAQQLPASGSGDAERDAADLLFAALNTHPTPAPLAQQDTTTPPSIPALSF